MQKNAWRHRPLYKPIKQRTTGNFFSFFHSTMFLSRDEKPIHCVPRSYRFILKCSAHQLCYIKLHKLIAVYLDIWCVSSLGVAHDDVSTRQAVVLLSKMLQLRNWIEQKTSVVGSSTRHRLLVCVVLKILCVWSVVWAVFLLQGAGHTVKQNQYH